MTIGDTTPGMEKTTLAGGCFWCLEAVFDQLQGVHNVESGYMGGHTTAPTYDDICGGDTGHAEVVQITFDPAVVSFRELLEVFFVIHDPTTLNAQGNDFGTQYRSGIFYHSERQQDEARTVIANLAKAKLWGKPIVTEVTAASTFYIAEDYHQEYFENNPGQPYCSYVVEPKVTKFRKQFMKKLKRP